MTRLTWTGEWKTLVLEVLDAFSTGGHFKKFQAAARNWLGSNSSIRYERFCQRERQIE